MYILLFSMSVNNNNNKKKRNNNNSQLVFAWGLFMDVMFRICQTKASSSSSNNQSIKKFNNICVIFINK